MTTLESPAAELDQVRKRAVCAVVEQARSGNEDAFEYLYRGHVGPVSRYVRAMVRDADRAEDVTAQTFFLAWRDLPKLRDPACFDYWLFRIAHNQAMTELSHRRVTASLDDAPDIADEGRFGAPESALTHALEVEHLGSAIAALPEMQRRVVLLRYFQELPCAEIARQLGKNEQSIWALTYRALKGLRHTLQVMSLPETRLEPSRLTVASR